MTFHAQYLFRVQQRDQKIEKKFTQKVAKQLPSQKCQNIYIKLHSTMFETLNSHALKQEFRWNCKKIIFRKSSTKCCHFLATYFPPKNCLGLKKVAKWWNFAKSGHPVNLPHQCSLSFSLSKVCVCVCACARVCVSYTLTQSLPVCVSHSVCLSVCLSVSLSSSLPLFLSLSATRTTDRFFSLSLSLSPSQSPSVYI